MKKYFECKWKDCKYKRLARTKNGNVSICLDCRDNGYCMWKGEIIEVELK